MNTWTRYSIERLLESASSGATSNRQT